MSGDDFGAPLLSEALCWMHLRRARVAGKDAAEKSASRLAVSKRALARLVISLL